MRGGEDALADGVVVLVPPHALRQLSPPYGVDRAHDAASVHEEHRGLRDELLDVFLQRAHATPCQWQRGS